MSSLTNNSPLVKEVSSIGSLGRTNMSRNQGNYQTLTSKASFSLKQSISNQDTITKDSINTQQSRYIAPKMKQSINKNIFNVEKKKMSN